MAEHDALLIEDGTGKQLAKLDASKSAALKLLMVGRSAGDVVFELQLDPYVRSFRHVSTHLLMWGFDEVAVRVALAAGRAYVGFDWMCDPTGFVFRATDGQNVFPMGSNVNQADDLRLQSEAPFSGTFRVIHGGAGIHHARGRSLDMAVTMSGGYQVEVWLNFPDDPRIWILSNPIYIGLPQTQRR